MASLLLSTRRGTAPARLAPVLALLEGASSSDPESVEYVLGPARRARPRWGRVVVAHLAEGPATMTTSSTPAACLAGPLSA